MAFWKYLGTQQNAVTPSGAETVERLCQRAQSATLLEDRRDAIRALKSLSRKFRQEVGTQGLEILTSVLHNDRNDAEILSYALDCLCNIMSNEILEDEQEIEKVSSDIGILFTEMFAKFPDNVTQLLSLLEEYDFHVRWPTVKLLTIMLINKAKEIQDIVLANPLGTPKLMDLLADNREVIRNDALLLLQHLTKGNTNIQKIVAFENAFERLLDIIESEGRCDGGIVVEDSLVLLLNLLKNNVSNQNFFKEGSYIQRLVPLFEMPLAEDGQKETQGWSAQRVTNFTLLLQVLRTLVSPNNPQQQTSSCQKLMLQCDLLGRLCELLMASGVPADVLTETINAVSEAIRGSQSNQDYFATVMAPTNPPRPAIVILLMSMVNDRQPFALRLAVLYCFECFLYRNEIGQSQIVQTLLPSTAEVTAMSAGQLLCGGLFSSDPLSTWLSAVALLHTMVNNPTQKEQLLRVQLATGIGNAPVTLLQQCSIIVTQSTKTQTRIGLLMLHCHWLALCPMAVDHFLYITPNIPYLISQVCGAEGDDLEVIVQGLCAFLLGLCVLYNTDQVESYKRAALRQIIENRIGVELFTDKLLQVTKTEIYGRAAKKPQLNYKQPADVVLDYEFTVLFRKLENDIIKSVSPGHDNDLEVKKAVSGATLDQHENIVEHYKELIREQDSQLTEVRVELRDSKSKLTDAQKSITQLMEQLQTVKDQNALLKAQQKGSSTSLHQASSDGIEVSKLKSEIESLKKEVVERDRKIEELRTTTGNDQALNSLREELQLKLNLKENEAKDYRDKYEDSTRQIAFLQNQLTVNGSATTAAAVNSSEVQAAVKAAEDEKNRTLAELLTLQQRFSLKENELAQLQDRVKQVTEEKTLLEKKQRDLSSEYDTIKREQDDLLMLLSEQETKISNYKGRLKALGQPVPDDDDDDEDFPDGDHDFDKD